MQQRRRRWGCPHLLLLLLISSFSGQQLLAAAQDAAASPSPAPTDGGATAPPSPSPAAADGSNPATATTPSPSPEASAPSPAVSEPPPVTPPPPTPPPPTQPAGDTGTVTPPPPETPPADKSAGSDSSSTGGANDPAVNPASGGAANDSSARTQPPTQQPPGAAGTTDNGTTVPPTAGTAPGTTPPATGSTAPTGSTGGTTGGSTSGGVSPTTTPPTNTTPSPGGGATGAVLQPPAASPEQPKNETTLPGYVLPTPDETAIDGISPSSDECQLMSALYAAMGASTSTNCGSGSSSSNSVASLQDVQSSMQHNSEMAKSSARFRDGLFTNKNGASFCVSTAGAAEMAQSSARNAQFQSVADVRELPDIEDPACEDQYATERGGCPPRPSRDGPVFFADTEGDGSSSPSPNPEGSGEASPSPSPSPSPEPIDLQNCSKKFTRVGTQPRSVAVILLRWRREYYKSKEECCKEQDNIPGCDCSWGGVSAYTWENMPPPKAYSRLFTDECDKGPSLNRAYFDMTGGRITFHSKLRVPVPSGFSLAGERRSVVTVSYNNGSAWEGGESPSPSPEPSPSPSPEPYVVPTDPIETPNSYRDPNGVDVYGWATLDAMRNEQGDCKDWCQEAINQLGVNDTEYNHIVCLQHLGSPALCDTCKEGECLNTCPAATGITTGCGCATCYYAWGGQAGCSEPAAPGIKTGLGAWMGTYSKDMLEMAGGAFIVLDQGAKMFLGHEIGHNMGLTHTGSLVCPFTEDGVINREPTACKPSWYGDSTSFMGSGQTLQLPAAIRYKVRWLPRNTLKIHPPGTERRWLLRPITIRRPSWQSGRRVRWFGNGTSNSADALAIRIPLVNPADGRATIGGYTCPCNPKVDSDPASPGMCPACDESRQKAGENPCKDTPCCTDPKCADGGLTWYYVELHMPFRNDYGSTYRGVAVRMMGELASNNCTSTRQVPTHVEGGQLKYLLNQADPTGDTLGSKFVDTLRGVTVVLERWTNTSAIVRIIA